MVELIAQGLSNKEIASELDCKVKTVENMITRILRSANARNRVELLWSLTAHP